MLIISKIDSGKNAVKLILEGRITGPWVEELQKSCDEDEARSCTLTLDLSGVSFVDAVGVELLCRLKSKGVLVTGCSPFVDAQLSSAKPSGV